MTEDRTLEWFGCRVRAAREQRGWSLRDLTAKSGVPFTTWSRVERGGEASLSAAAKVASALGIPLDQLLAAPACHQCADDPPQGFICAACGRNADDSPS